MATSKAVTAVGKAVDYLAPAVVESSFWSIMKDNETFNPLSNSPEPENVN